MSTTNDSNDRRVLGFLGVGFDGKDGHERLTRSEHFFLVGGSEETHGSMQEVAIKFAEALTRRGKELQDASVEEILELLDGASDS